MKVRDYELDIEFLEELEQFDWVNSQVRGNKFQACSPFREENNPSFAVNLENGTFKDSGAIDFRLLKGNFILLLSHLRNESYEEVEDYLIDKYATILRDTDALQLHLNLYGEADKPTFIDKSQISHLYTAKTDYLTNRRISEEVQQLFGCGYDLEHTAIALLWTDLKGRIVNVKYRRTNTKSFYYEKGGQPVKNYVFGLYQCKVKGAKRVYICESEIDAMYLWSCGYYAVALGGSSISEKQINQLLSAGIEELVIATDNDAVGHRFRKTLIETFSSHVQVLDFSFPEGVKDVNELDANTLKTICEQLLPTYVNFLGA